MKDGTPYRPSNGTEGMCFQAKFCENCIHEKWSHTMKRGDKQCDILSNAILFDMNDEQFPKEWCYVNNTPTCTKWSKWDWGNNDENEGLNEPPTPEPVDPNQLCLPFILEEMEFIKPKIKVLA